MFGACVGVELLVGVHLVAVLVSELVGHPQCLAVRDEEHPDGRQHHRQVGLQRDGRERERGQALRQRAHHLDTLGALEVQPLADQDRREEHHQSSRELRVDAWHPEQHGDARGADREGGPVGLGELPDDPEQLLHGVALGLLHAEELVQLPDGHEEGQAHDEAVHDRLGQELRDEPQAQHPGAQEHQPGDQHERRRARTIGPRVVGVSGRGDHRGRDRGRQQRCRGGGRTDRQVPRGAHQRVDRQRHDQRVEARLRGQARDAGVGHALRDEQAPQGQPRDRIPPPPITLVRRPPGQDRQVRRNLRPHPGLTHHVVALGAHRAHRRLPPMPARGYRPAAPA